MGHTRQFLILLTLMFSIFAIGARAEINGRKVLDKAATFIRKSGDIRVSFAATSFRGTNEEGSIRGTLLLQGKKFQLNTPEMITWFDGATQWSYLTENEEVNITQPTEKEIQAVNPYVFLDLYKKGYSIEMKESTLRDTPTYEVHLVAQKAEIAAQEIFIDVRQSDFCPLCVRVRQEGIWNRISIWEFNGGQHFTDKDFTFPKEQYPDAELIDLR
ncbi:MAG: hypothetical protein K5945_11025 [Bacteroidaceae bacterium]|nr:hypothetical protein [Bacteroidaceae bacterium]